MELGKAQETPPSLHKETVIVPCSSSDCHRQSAEKKWICGDRQGPKVGVCTVFSAGGGGFCLMLLKREEAG